MKEVEAKDGSSIIKAVVKEIEKEKMNALTADGNPWMCDTHPNSDCDWHESVD